MVFVVALVAATASIGSVLIGCSSFSCKRGIYFRRVKNNLKTLKHYMKCLKNLKDRIEKRTQQQDRSWFDKVQGFQERAKEKEKEAEEEIRNMCVRWFCPTHFCSFEGLDIELTDISQELKDVIKNGEDIEKELVDIVSVDKRPVVGLQDLTDQIQNFLAKSGVHIIGVYDTQRGSGNLLIEVSKKLTTNFLVISVKVGNLENKLAQIQEVIIKKLQLWENQPEDDRSSVIHNFLSKNKFVLLLDGLTDGWEYSDLSRIGIPDSHESKIIITAPTESVFEKMKIDVCVETESFEPNDARLVFKHFANKSQRPLVIMSPEGSNNKYSLLAEPLPLDLARSDAMAEGRPIFVGIIVVNWVLPPDQKRDANASWPNGKLVQIMDDEKYLKHSPY